MFIPFAESSRRIAKVSKASRPTPGLDTFQRSRGLSAGVLTDGRPRRSAGETRCPAGSESR